MKYITINEEFDWRMKIFNSLPFPSLILTPEKVIISANQAFLEKKKTDLNNVVGKTCHQIFYDTEKPCAEAICPFYKVIAEKKPQSILRRTEFNGDEEVWVDRMFSPILDDRGDVKFIMESVRDASRVITLEKRSIHIRQFLDKVIQSSPNAIITADRNGNLLLMNQAAERLFGYSMEEAIRTKNAEDFYPFGKAREIMKKLKNKNFGGEGTLTATRVDVVNEAGEVIPVEMTANLIYEGDKEVASTGIFYDLREKIAAEKKLKEILIQVAQSEKMASLGQLAAGVAHEINNPLTGILLYGNLALERVENDENPVRRYLKSVIDDAERCRDIVKNLLAYSRQASPTKEIFQVNSLIEHSLNLIRDQELLLNITVVKEMSDEMMLIHADKNQLSQVIINLVMNAADAMEKKGALTFRTYRKKPLKKVYIEVSDTGCGISEEHLSKIFDPFFTTKETGKGTGLGLSTSYGIIKENGGQISIKDTSNRGTTFLIELPLYTPDEKQSVLQNN
ncbi:MAG: PAS domain S-box protein [Desulfobacterales bacterium]|jgi:PAS domain S-box-containing protein|nr:PAS domain S-box protein [Desulfobacterales bacterium]